jgi:CO dehydrogenase maturation factor
MLRSMRIAFIGKGGAGKSVVAGTLARLLAATGEPVLAVDSDPLPGLAVSLGVESSDAPLPAEAIEQAPDGARPRFRLAAGMTAEEAVERYAPLGPDGVRFLQFGKPRDRGRDLLGSQAVFRQIVAELPPERWSVVGDLPGGTRQPFFGWGGYAEALLVVVEPTPASLLTARRLAKLGRGEGAPTVVAVATKTADTDDVDRVADRTGLEVLAAIPYDEAVRAAERRGRPLLDHAPAAPATAAVASLLERVRNLQGVRA